MLTFKERVIDYVKKIPKGKVVSYGQVASFVGSPRAARQVGQVLKNMDLNNSQIPWWRVINSKGEISIKGNWIVGKNTQKDLLLKDGVEVSNNCIIDIEKYRW